MSDVAGSIWTEEAGFIICDVNTEAEEIVLLGILCHLIDRLDGGSSVEVIGDEIAALRSLFSTLQATSQRAETGLWGELFVISEAVDPVAVAQAWGNDPSSVFDFANEGERLEIKTTLRPQREHMFSLSQLIGARTNAVKVLSIMTTEVASGTSIVDLLTRAQNRLLHYPTLRQQVLVRTVESAGEALNRPRRFDETQARATVRAVAFEQVPAPSVTGEIIDLTWTVRLQPGMGSATRHQLCAAAGAITPL